MNPRKYLLLIATLFIVTSTSVFAGTEPCTSLHDAVRSGNITEVQKLLDAGWDPTETDINGLTPYQFAKKLGKDKIANRIALYATSLKTPMQTVMESKNPVKIKSLLIRSGINPNLHDLNGFTPLHYAVALNMIEIVILLLQLGANPEVKSIRSCYESNPAQKYGIPVGTSPKELAKKLAIKMRNPQILKILLDAIEEKRIIHSVEIFLTNHGDTTIGGVHTTEEEPQPILFIDETEVAFK